LVVVAEPHQDIADALQDVVALAGCVPIVVSRYESVSDLQSVPAAIVVRVAMEMPMMSPHRGLQESSLTQRPLIVALASNDADVAEAERLGCEIIARAPHQVQALYQALTRLSSR
jgi:DNA-binding NtrC family response regulator